MVFFRALRVLACMLVFCLLLSGASVYMRGVLLPAAPVGADGEGGPTLILDAGHGGRDGGAISADGVLEKDLNLQITLKLGALLEAEGYHVVYTRTDDRALYTAAQDIPGKRKMYDLRNRLVIAEEAERPILISIHMNKFSDPKYSGLQVYYAPSDGESRILAQAIQSGVRSSLQPQNGRHIKRADSSIYLLNHARFPAVRVECGFLSNLEECQKLSSEDYQKQLSFSIFCAIIEYMKDK